MPQSETVLRTTRGIQQTSFPLRPIPRPELPLEAEGSRVHEALGGGAAAWTSLEYTARINLVDAVAVEPAAGEGAFLGPMIERLA